MDDLRANRILHAGIIGVLVNVLLSAFKFFVGIASNSVSVRMDAVNNLSDALSSTITIFGIKMSGKAPDRKHPLGHGRIEYLSAVSVAAVILFAGASSLIESIRKIMNPVAPDHSVIGMVIIAASVIVKVALGLHDLSRGKENKSDALCASGKDALFDAMISTSVLAAAIIWIAFGINLEAPLGAAISLYIIKSGIGMVMDTSSEILGRRVDPELAKSVKGIITSFPQVFGAYDLIIHNYGPANLIGSVHIEIPEDMVAADIDALERSIAEKVYDETGIAMTGISIYARNKSDEFVVMARNEIMRIVGEYPDVVGMHGFYADEVAKSIRCDVIISLDCKERQRIYDEVVSRIKSIRPDWDFHIILDADISD